MFESLVHSGTCIRQHIIFRVDVYVTLQVAGHLSVCVRGGGSPLLFQFLKGKKTSKRKLSVLRYKKKWGGLLDINLLGGEGLLHSKPVQGLGLKKLNRKYSDIICQH